MYAVLAETERLAELAKEWTDLELRLIPCYVA